MLELADQRIAFAQRALVRSDGRVTRGNTDALLAHHLAQRVYIDNYLK
jgi:hypothetical protein